MVDLTLINGYALSFYEMVLPVLLLSAAIVIYASLVGASYKTMSKRDIFKFERIRKARKEHRGHPVITFFIGIFEYFAVFPVIVVLWFALLSALLFILSESLDAGALITISVAIVGSTRMLSYFNEEIAVDVAKLFPLVLLGAFLLEPGFFHLDLLYSRIGEIPALLPLIAHYTAVPILIEWILRFLFELKELVFPSKDEEEKE